jgi:UDP-N-acetylmuramoyl-L-alanyl-D-glutamate--2,6-diaminopimelate ligase
MSMKLFDILPENDSWKVQGNGDISISGLTLDSRTVVPGYLYAALKGSLVDGHDYIDGAIDKGATVVLCENISLIKEGVTYIVTSDVRKVLGHIANVFYDNDANDYTLIGVTGTNGKTTVATLLFQLFSKLGYTCGLISTVANRIGQEIVPATHTTPDVVQLHKLISQMRSRGCSHIFMEVSSHAVDQQRISGLDFTGAIFTNITQDHLDYHKTMKAYISAKKQFFDDLPKSAFALVNADDANGLVMVQNTKANKCTYGLKTMADFKTKIIESTLNGLHLKINDVEAYFRLIGAFNAYNLSAVYGAAMLLDADKDEVLAILSNLTGADGRFEQMIDTKTNKAAIVDYAHTPDALDNVLTTIAKIKSSQAKIITVVGCGGNRDKTKRPIMAKIAIKHSDHVVFTSDNPRNENPESIIDDMMQDLDASQMSKVLRITDRTQAIKTAVMIAHAGDVILIAGKGHETYQEINGEKFPFDDKEVVREIFG